MTEGRRAMVTGGTDGIGFHLSRLLAAGGYKVTIVARSAGSLEKTVRNLEGSGHDFIAADLADRKAVADLVKRVESGSFDLLINNAGGTRFGAFSSLTDAEVTASLDVNLVAPARLSRAFIASAPAHGVLVNITSGAGTVPMPGNAVYSAAKAGLQALAECLWWELKQRPVRIMEYRPVSVRTRFHESAGGRPLAESAVAPEAAARDILERIEKGGEFVQSPGLSGLVVETMRRVLPARVRLAVVGRRAEKAGYLK